MHFVESFKSPNFLESFLSGHYSTEKSCAAYSVLSLAEASDRAFSREVELRKWFPFAFLTNGALL